MIRAIRGPLVQLLLVGDLEDPRTQEWYLRHMPRVGAIYSDPPWNPGIAANFRRMAGAGPLHSFERFCASWVSVARLAYSRGALDVLVEQSANPAHQRYLLDAMAATEPMLPYLEQWRVQYSGGPNALLHFGRTALTTDPTDMNGEAMTIRALSGLGLPAGSWLVEPCVGKGMTSRVAHKLGLCCIGTEIGEDRLRVAVNWLAKHGYSVEDDL